MTKTDKYKPLWLRSVAGVLLLTSFSSAIVPLFMLPFINILPYLQTLPLWERLLWSTMLTLVAILFGFIATTKKQRRSIAALTMSSWKDIAWGALGCVMFIFAAAALNDNLFGSLVKIFPNDPYIARFEVTTAEFFDSRNKSVTLGLKAQSNGKLHYLTLSKRLFDYPKFQRGDVLILKGRRNIFGTYVESFEKNVPSNIPANLRGI